MADTSLPLHLLMVILCLDSAHGQTTDYPYHVPASLLPVACIIVAVSILVLCLIGCSLICLSTLATTDDDDNEMVVGGVSGNHTGGKTLTPKHDSYKRDDPPTRQKEEGLALKVKWELDELSDDVTINMDPYHCGSELKNTTRSFFQGVGVGEAPQLIPAAGSVLSMPSRSLEDVNLKDLDREVGEIASAGVLDRNKERGDEQLWKIKVHANRVTGEQGFRHMDRDPEIIVRG